MVLRFGMNMRFISELFGLCVWFSVFVLTFSVTMFTRVNDSIWPELDSAVDAVEAAECGPLGSFAVYKHKMAGYF